MEADTPEFSTAWLTSERQARSTLGKADEPLRQGRMAEADDSLMLAI